MHRHDHKLGLLWDDFRRSLKVNIRSVLIPTTAEDSGPHTPMERFLRWLVTDSRRVFPALSVILIAAISYLDYEAHPNISLGFLYLIPIVMASIHLPRWQIVGLAAACAIMRHLLGPFEYGNLTYPLVSLEFVCFVTAGLFIHELVQNQSSAMKHVEALEHETQLRRDAEEQFRLLIESSPAAIMTLNREGCIELSNQAAERMFGCGPGSLSGRSIADLLPVIFDLARSVYSERPYRNAMNCRGVRLDGEFFMASVWYASYPTLTGQKAAIILSDLSEEMRDMQEANVESLLRNTRVLVGSVAHEIRNFCAAIQVVHNNLSRVPGVGESEDSRALSSLADGLARIATVELTAAGEGEPGTTSLNDVLDDLRIIVSASCHETEVHLRWNVPESLPLVAGDHSNLLHVFLNLTRNSQRVLENAEVKELEISALSLPDHVTVPIHDSGPGVTDPEKLFGAFQVGADGSGLGLFVSRALVRACEGELYHVPGGAGCTMAVRLRPVASSSASLEENPTEVDVL